MNPVPLPPHLIVMHFQHCIVCKCLKKMSNGLERVLVFINGGSHMFNCIAIVNYVHQGKRCGSWGL